MRAITIAACMRAVFFTCSCLSLPAQAEERGGKRIALVIGNDQYQKVRPLEKAVNDARAMARELKTAGFEVQEHHNLDFRATVKAVETLANRITGGDQVVVFFAGHGVQIRSGSFLLPVDIDAASESEVEKTAYGLNDLMDRLHEARAGFTLVMIDACRDNPIRSNGRSVGGTRGLAPIEPPKGQMIIFSASRGQQALDRMGEADTNPNGVFTREFIARMRKPGVKVDDLMREVQDSVESLARTISHEQRPAIYNEARGSFYFFGPTTVVSQSATATPARARTVEEIEDAYWDAIKDERDAALFADYIKLYPAGRYLALANIRLNKARQAVAPPRPVLPVNFSEASWRMLEASEMYRNLPQRREVRVDSAYEEWQAPVTQALDAPANSPSARVTHQKHTAPLGSGCQLSTMKVQTEGRSIETGTYACGVPLGYTQDGKQTDVVTLKSVSGSLYPPRLGAQLQYTITMTRGTAATELRATCRISAEHAARDIDPRLTGKAWEHSCIQTRERTDITTEPRSEVKSTEYWLEDMGVNLWMLGVQHPTLPRVLLPRAGSRESLPMPASPKGQEVRRAYSRYDWRISDAAP